MTKLTREFISEEPREYPVKIGHHVASALSGFIAGTIFATLIWGFVVMVLVYTRSA